MEYKMTIRKEVIGNCELYLGDCMEVMPMLGEIDAVIADPPYGTTACKWDSIIPLIPMWKLLKYLIKPNGAIVLTSIQPFTTNLISSNINMFKYCWVYEKDKPSNFALANRQPMKYHEDICVFYDKQCTYNKQITKNHKPMNGQSWYGRSSNGSVPYLNVLQTYKGGKTTRNPSSIQKFNTPKHNSSDKSGLHPTQKPIELMEYLIKTYTNQEETVLDFTMGSGTTGVACINTNRKFIGIEKEPEYFDIACKRIEQAISKYEQLKENGK
jgi:DNA modification methylase